MISSEGRWVHGKLLFSIASAISTFFGLSIGEKDRQRLRLPMVQSILNNHAVVDVSYAPHIFFVEKGENNGRTE